MQKKSSLNIIEIKKIQWTEIVKNYFEQYEELFSLYFSICSSSKILNGNKTSSDKEVIINSVFKYEDDCYVWNNFGINHYEINPEDKTFIQKHNFMNNFINIKNNFYIQHDNKKLSFDDFKEKLNPNFLLDIHQETESVSFSRDSFIDDLANFLGKEILIKIEKEALDKKLPNLNHKKNQIPKI